MCGASSSKLWLYAAEIKDKEERGGRLGGESLDLPRSQRMVNWRRRRRRFSQFSRCAERNIFLFVLFVFPPGIIYRLF